MIFAVRRATTAAPAGVALLLLLAAVGLAGRPAGGVPLRVPGSAGSVVLDAAFYLVMALGLLVAALAAWALWPDPQRPPLEARRRGLWQRYAGVLAVWAVAVALMVFARRSGGQLAFQTPRPAAAPQPGDLAGAGQAASQHGLALVALAVEGMLRLLAAGAAVYLLRAGTARPRPVGRRPGGLAELLDDGLEDMARESDPRRAVIAAYARMERVLALSGLPRDPAEAPLEYTRRVLRELDVGAAGVRRLADLFELAKFSRHAVVPAMREEAIAALTTLRNELRGLRGGRDVAPAP